MRLKTLCACLTLVTYAGIAMEPPSDGEMRSAGKATAENRSGPIDQANLENFSKEELLREIARLRQENTDLQQKVKKHESVLDEVLDETIHTRDKKVLKEEHKQLVRAVKNEDTEKLKFLIDQGMDVDETVYGKYYTPLIVAIKDGKVDTVKFLLNNGADLKKSPKALVFAVKTGKKDLVKLLLEKGADPNVLDKNGNSVLILALEKGYAEIAKMFLSGSDNNLVLDLIYSGKNKMPMSDDDIRFRERLASFEHYDTPNYMEESPLMHAISSKKISDSDLQGIVKSLLKNGADVNRTDNLGMSVLKFAKEAERSEEIIKLLEDAGAIEYKEDNKKSPVVRLYEYIRSSRDFSLSDLRYEYKSGDKGFMCTLCIKEEIFELKGRAYKSKRAAKDAIAGYVYNVLTRRARNGQASSSRAN